MVHNFKENLGYKYVDFFFKTMYNAGDLIQTAGGAGEVVDTNEDGDLEVYFIVSNKSKANGKIYEYNEEWEVVKKVDVLKHVPRPLDKFKYPQCYREIGFKVWDGIIFTRVEDDEELDEDLKKFTFPTDCIEYESEDEDVDMSDFIVPDEEGEPFRPASPSSQFVRDVHQAVHDYNKWTPTDRKAKAVKTVIDNMGEKYSRIEDDRQFALGKVVNYNHPPLKKASST